MDSWVVSQISFWFTVRKVRASGNAFPPLLHVTIVVVLFFILNSFFAVQFFHCSWNTINRSNHRRSLTRLSNSFWMLSFQDEVLGMGMYFKEVGEPLNKVPNVHQEKWTFEQIYGNGIMIFQKYTMNSSWDGLQVPPFRFWLQQFTTLWSPNQDLANIESMIAHHHQQNPTKVHSTITWKRAS